MIRAVIDIGTNSVKLLVGEVSGRNVRPLWEESDQTRLGRGFYEACELQAAAMADTTQAVVKFAATAHRLQAGSLRVIATSAVRDAHNAAELTGSIYGATGLLTEIISGELRGVKQAQRGAAQNVSLLRLIQLLADERRTL